MKGGKPLEIYFSPELISNESHVLNIIDQDKKAVGYLAFLFEKKKMYVYGHLEKDGVSEDFKGIIKPYIEGMTKARSDLDVYSYVSVGGKKISLDQSNDS